MILSPAAVDEVRAQSAEGRLGVLLAGMGAVATTFVAGVQLVRRGFSRPVGSLTQMATLAPSPQAPSRPLRELVPLARLDSLAFAGWDLFADDAATTAERAAVLSPQHLALVRDELSALRPMPAVYLPQYVRRLRGEHVKPARLGLRRLGEALREDIRRFKHDEGLTRAVCVWCGSTEVHQTLAPVHRSLAAFERGLDADDPELSPSMLYAWACLREGVPFANGAPNLTLEAPALVELARELRVPIAGRDFKTGQTWMKTILAPALAARQLGVKGWFSTNILGNRDGEVLDDPEAFRTKESSKLGVLEELLDASRQPELYGDLFHKVRIEYYPPRGDAKEGWDNIDIFGWLGYPMQIKIDFLCRDSILAAPLVLDLVLLLDLAQRSGKSGPQDWLSFYFKAPQGDGSKLPTHDMFAQRERLHRELLSMAAAFGTADLSAR